MSYTISEQKQYSFPNETIIIAALGAIEGLEGKLVGQESAEGHTEISAKFHKTIHGKVLGDRTHLDLVIDSAAPDETTINVSVHPLDAVGRPLQFGARKGVAQTVVNWFFAHLEHRLPKS